MKHFLIEINKPFIEGEAYRKELQRRINECEFEVVAVCNTEDEVYKENSKFILQNIRNQSHKHYEIIEGNSGLSKLSEKIEDFYKKLDK
jgi:hypothetical protein